MIETPAVAEETVNNLNLSSIVATLFVDGIGYYFPSSIFFLMGFYLIKVYVVHIVTQFLLQETASPCVSATIPCSSGQPLQQK